MKNLQALFTRHKGMFLVLLILCVLSMIIVPIPQPVMDVLIGVNIGLTLVVLMTVLYMNSPIELTSFPSILLVLALFRIGITISTSRLILLDGNAGEIISTFGEFVVGGNLIVGIIIFSIITLINFIVITKGSERVAEVAARFSLDAMPGKQMSIDSDLRANTIDMAEAQRRRNVLALESKLYGAMDGAMKFVKGDAIASIIDIIINLVGGLIIGMVQHGLGFGEALQTYSILTVGDGLVQQIPALLISLTSGMMITRVSDDDGEKENIGSNIINQIFKSPKVLFSSSVLFLLMAIIPGMPSGVFGVLFVLIVAFGIYLIKRGKGGSSSGMGSADDIVQDSNKAQEIDADFVSWKLQPLVVSLALSLKNDAILASIKKSLIEVRKETLVNLGVEVPQVIIRYDAKLAPDTYQLMVFELPVVTAKLYQNHILLPQLSHEVSAALNIREQIANETDIGLTSKGIWISKDYADKCAEYQVEYIEIEQYLLLHLTLVLKAHISEFFGMQEVKNMLDKIGEYQDLIKELLRMLPLNKITEVLQRLLAEGISIRNFKVILDAMLEWAQREKEVIIITEYVRRALGRYIAYQYSKGTYVISCFLLDADIEDMVRDSIRFNEQGSYLAMDPNLAANIVEAVETICNKQQHLKTVPVIMTQMDIRRYMRSIIEKELPGIHVLSFQEVEAHVKFNSLGIIQI